MSKAKSEAVEAEIIPATPAEEIAPVQESTDKAAPVQADVAKETHFDYKREIEEIAPIVAIDADSVTIQLHGSMIAVGLVGLSKDEVLAKITKAARG